MNLIQRALPIRGRAARRPRRATTNAGAPLRRVAFVSDAVWPFNTGGKEKRLDEITRRLAREGREVHVYTMKWWDGPSTIHRDGVAFHALCRHYPLYAGDRRSMKQALRFGLATLRLLTARFDAVEVDHMPFFPLFAARAVCGLRRKQMFAAWHEVWGGQYWRSYLGVMGVFGHLTEQLSFRAPHGIISNSAHTTARLRQARPGLRMWTVPLGADFERIFTIPPAATNSDVVFAGRLLAHKNVDLLIEAVALLRPSHPDLRCLVVGEGPERLRLEQLADRRGVLGTNVEFRDFLPDQDDLFAVMKASKVFALPSEREGFGILALEANACELPVVALRHPSNAAQQLIVDGENGYLCDPEPHSLADAIARCLAHPERLNPKKTLVERFAENDWATVAARVGRILDGTEEPDENVEPLPGSDPTPFVQVVPYYPPHLGGMENVAYAIASELAQRGPVEVLTSSRGPAAPAQERSGRTLVRRLPTVEFAHLPVMPTLLWHLLRLPRTAVVHVHTQQAYAPEMVALAAWLRRRPFVTHYHFDVPPSGRLGFLFVLYKRHILNHVLRAAARTVVLSEDQAAFVVQHFGVDPERVVVIPNGVGAEYFAADEGDARREGPLRVLFVGRLVAQKNLGRMLRAVASTTAPVELVLVGEGEEHARVERLCTELGLDNVRLVGEQNREEVVAWYRWADAFLLTSDGEGMPLVLLEAMAAGLPVVATDVPGINNLAGGTALLCPPDPQALAAALDRVATDEQLRADLAARSRRQGAACRWAEVADAWCAVYRDVSDEAVRRPQGMRG